MSSVLDNPMADSNRALRSASPTLIEPLIPASRAASVSTSHCPALSRTPPRGTARAVGIVAAKASGVRFVPV